MHQQQRNNKETNVNFWQPPRLFTAATPPPPQQTLRSVYDYGELQQLGCGAYAQVYKGIDLLPGSDKMTPAYREVALKRINLASLADKEVYKVTVNEVQLFQTLNHRNIVQCYYHFDEISPYTNNHYLVLVLEYVNGGDLQNWLKNRTLPYQMLVSERDIWFIFAQIAEAVAYTHSKQIMHRDLKPENVLLTIDWCVKLADFGLSRLLQVVQVAQTVCGTPYYMSPERIAECPYTFKSDIWSMGCILYEMATLKSPFYGEKDNITSLVEKIRRAQFPPVQDDCYTDQLEMLVQTCLALDPEKRPTSGEVSRVSRVMNERWQAYNDTNVYTISADGLVPTASSSEPSSSSFTGCVESVDKLKAEETKRWGSH